MEKGISRSQAHLFLLSCLFSDKNSDVQRKKDYNLPVLLLMSILTQSLLPLMRGDLVTFTFFSARHNKISFDNE